VLLRDFVGNGLICLAVFGTKWGFAERFDKIPGSTGKTGIAEPSA
jgi:hypothetical protein